MLTWIDPIKAGVGKIVETPHEHALPDFTDPDFPVALAGQQKMC